MKNLATRRSEAWTEHGRNLYCPHSPDYKPCSTEYCAHYNPDTQECVHVEAAQAQVRIADALEALADTVHTGFDGTRHLQINR